MVGVRLHFHNSQSETVYKIEIRKLLTSTDVFFPALSDIDPKVLPIVKPQLYSTNIFNKTNSQVE